MPWVAPANGVARILGSWFPADLVQALLATRVSTDKHRVMAASVRHLRLVRACAADVVTWDCRNVFIGRGTPQLGFRRSIWANSHKIEDDVGRKEAMRRFRQDVEKSPILLAQLPDITGTCLVCRTSEDGHASALQGLCDLHGMAHGFDRVVMIGKLGREVGNLDRLRDSLLVCDSPAYEPCHGDFMASAIPPPTSCAAKRLGQRASFHEGSKKKATSLISWHLA